jgi:sulfoxide reductase heme-binding subunit YedZ
MVRQLNSALRNLPVGALYLVAVFPPAWFLWLGLTGGLGIEPITALEHRIGKLGLQVLTVTLAVTPLRRITGLSLLRFRRALGLIGFFYIGLHLLVWLGLDVQLLSAIWNDIVKRPYITIGMSAFVLLIPLALTSNDRMLRRMGVVAWRRLHRLAYPAILLGSVHYVMVGKTWDPEAIVYLVGIGGLLLLRLQPFRRRVAA